VISNGFAVIIQNTAIERQGQREEIGSSISGVDVNNFFKNVRFNQIKWSTNHTAEVMCSP